ncbi:MAG: hypothetical protein ABI978_04345 [Chloroflexota bacterium]
MAEDIARGSAASSVEAESLRDAQAIADRIAIDREVAAEAAEQYATEGLPVLSDPSFDAIALPGEVLHAIHRSALLEVEERGTSAAKPVGGTLYLTSRRLVHAGTTVTEIRLGKISEAAVALQRLVLLRMKDGADLALEVTQPRLLMVQLEAAQAS